MSLPTNTRRDGESEEAFLARLRGQYDGRATMARMLERAVQREPEKLALVDGRGARLTYRQLGDKVGRLAGGLKQAGVRPEDRVAVMMRSHAGYVLAYYALITRGSVIVPVNVRLAAPELAYMLDNAGVEVILADPEFEPVVTEAIKISGNPRQCFWTDGGDSWEALFGGEAEPFHDVAEEDLAAIYYTSGTTGKPKGAMITHRNMTAVGQQNVEAWFFDDAEVVELEISPLFHVSFQEFGPTIHSVGGTLVVDNFSPERSLDLIEQEGVNAFFAVPSMLLLMLEAQQRKARDLSRVRLVKYGGAPMPSDLMARVRAAFPHALLVQGFGQTESTGMIAVTWPDEVYAYPLSTGRAISGCDIRVVDDMDVPVPTGAIGEIVAKGPQVMAGYWENPGASADTLAGGYLHTGDLGYLDEGGRLYIVDRKKDLIIRGGQNIYSAEVEEALYGHPAVREAAVVGKPDTVYGEVVVAFVRIRGNATVTPEGLDAYMASRIASYKRPVAYHFIDELPRTANGKVRKVELREQLS
jgi:long-chain acyl-CoA synthetase